MNRLSRLGVCAIELCSLIVALGFFSGALSIQDPHTPNGYVKTVVKRSIASGSCYCCMATYDAYCCQACTSHWDVPIPFYAPEKKRTGSIITSSSNGIDSGSDIEPVSSSDLQGSPYTSITDLSLVSCACCQTTKSKPCCETCKMATGLPAETAVFKNPLPDETTGLIRKRSFNLGSSYSTCMCCTMTRWRGCCYRCPYGY